MYYIKIEGYEPLMHQNNHFYFYFDLNLYMYIYSIIFIGTKIAKNFLKYMDTIKK